MVDMKSSTHPKKYLSNKFENAPPKRKMKPRRGASFFNDILYMKINEIKKKLKISQKFKFGIFILKEIPLLHTKKPPV